MLVGSRTIYSARMWPLQESGSENDCLQTGEVFQKRSNGFVIILTIKRYLPLVTILCTIYIPVEEPSSLPCTDRRLIFIRMAALYLMLDPLPRSERSLNL